MVSQVLIWMPRTLLRWHAGLGKRRWTKRRAGKHRPGSLIQAVRTEDLVCVMRPVNIREDVTEAFASLDPELI
jgi:hypothetical protein